MRELEEDEIKITENDDYIVVTNHWCRTYTKQLREYDRDGISLDGWFVCRTISKKVREEFYVIYDDKGQPRASFDGHEDFDFKVMLLKMDYAEDNNIVNMAKVFRPQPEKKDQRKEWMNRGRRR